jgi:endonuclease YncB( thermonuclease family)
MRADAVTTTLAAIAGLVVIDGDTVHSAYERYRLLGIDAAEIGHAQCEAERRLGWLTKRRLEELLQSGPIAFHPDPPVERDKYGRLLIHLLVDGEDVGCVLIREGYARPWRGRREDWCVKTDLFKPADLADDCSVTGSIKAR